MTTADCEVQGHGAFDLEVVVAQIVDQHGRRMGTCLEEVCTVDAAAVNDKVLRLRNS